VLAGASAGAMGLAELTWTPAGIMAGLGVVNGVVIFPHADAAMWARQTTRFPPAVAAGMGVLGIGERTGVISTGTADGGGTAPWQVVGEGEVRWLPIGSTEPAVLVDGETVHLPT
jgi:hypothetical protein